MIVSRRVRLIDHSGVERMTVAAPIIRGTNATRATRPIRDAYDRGWTILARYSNPGGEYESRVKRHEKHGYLLVRWTGKHPVIPGRPRCLECKSRNAIPGHVLCMPCGLQDWTDVRWDRTTAARAIAWESMGHLFGGK